MTSAMKDIVALRSKEPATQAFQRPQSVGERMWLGSAWLGLTKSSQNDESVWRMCVVGRMPGTDQGGDVAGTTDQW